MSAQDNENPAPQAGFEQESGHKIESRLVEWNWQNRRKKQLSQDYVIECLLYAWKNLPTNSDKKTLDKLEKALGECISAIRNSWVH